MGCFSSKNNGDGKSGGDGAPTKIERRNDNEINATAKIVVMGNKSVGKTSIVKAYTSGTVGQTTAPTNIVNDFTTEPIKLDSKDGTVNLKFNIWDCAGDEAVQNLVPRFLPGAHCVI